ncbi:MAG TPA: hypothetical protein VFF98_17340 [Novosphingobium sp.]|nr:hypothetical protein [Novosphingobium sp.]HZV11306.1 hypothetical protein [Novosphingobium sp.]
MPALPAMPAQPATPPAIVQILPAGPAPRAGQLRPLALRTGHDLLTAAQHFLRLAAQGPAAPTMPFSGDVVGTLAQALHTALLITLAHTADARETILLSPLCDRLEEFLERLGAQVNHG